MTSTTPSYLKRAEQGGAKGLCTMESGAEASTVVFCLCACIRAGSSLFFLASGAPQEQVCAVVLYPALSLSRAIPTRVLPFLLFFPFFPSLFYFVSLSPYALLPLSYLLRLLHLFSLYARTPDLFVDSETS